MWAEMVDRMRDTPGLVILGAPGSGKTAISLELVQSSCFGVSHGGGGGEVKPLRTGLTV